MSAQLNSIALPGELEVASCQPPGIDDGTYTFTVQQKVAGGDNDGYTYTQDYTVTVVGPRFSLDPAQIVSLYPPPGSSGRYLDSLPQAVIERVTLPWERTLWADQPARRPTEPTDSPVPFVAVLVLDGSEAPAPRAMTVGDLITTGSPSILGPANMTLDSDEATTDRCTLVDLDAETFLQVTPLVSELPYLAHCRKVDPSSQPTPAQWDADPWYSVVLGNRLPAENTLNTAYLVSLEGFGDLLAGRQVPTGVSTVRLAVFASWQFTDDSAADPDFATLAAALNMSPPGLSLTLPATPAGDAGAAATQALDQGYLPLAYTTRFGENAVSWYRGPLTPLTLAAEPTTTYPCVDAALRFDPQLGMLDLSYAAAWQLGRLLAIAGPEYAPALLAWRRANQQNLQTLATNIQLAERLPGLPQPRELAVLSDRHRMPRLVRQWLADTLGPALLGTDPPSGPSPPDQPIADPEDA
jgi:hypothetical protein